MSSLCHHYVIIMSSLCHHYVICKSLVFHTVVVYKCGLHHHYIVCSPKGEVEVPQSSRHAALSLLLELSLHRAKLHKLLGIVFLLLQLATGGMVSSQPSPSLLMCILQIIVFWAISATISIVCKIISVGYQIRMLPLHHCYLKGSNYAL